MNTLLTVDDIERLRLEQGLSIGELCRRAGVTTTIYTRWKAGRFDPNLRNYARLCGVVVPELAPPAKKIATWKYEPPPLLAEVEPPAKPRTRTRAA